MKKRAVFVDKDGTIIKNVPYNTDVNKIELLPEVAMGLLLLQRSGYDIVMVSNQSGVAKGYFPERALFSVEMKIREILDEKGVTLNGFYYCPHHPDGMLPAYTRECFCRKPQAGMLFRAAIDQDIDLPASWMIGDTLHDVEAGNRAQCQTILINNGNETEWEKGIYRHPTHVVEHFLEAVNFVLLSALGMEGFSFGGFDNES